MIRAALSQNGPRSIVRKLIVYPHRPSVVRDGGGTRTSEQIEQGRACYERRAWRDACDAFARADEVTPLDVADLELLATASYLSGRDLDFENVLERLHRLHLDADDSQRAARCAFWLGFSLLLRGQIGPSTAWITRGERLVAGHECADRGYFLLPVAEQQLRAGAADHAVATAASAAAIGVRFGDADLTAAARHVQGRAAIQQGQIPTGLALLDETMLDVLAGALSPIMTGMMYCSVIGACREVYAWNRAREWTFALSRWCEQQPGMVAFTATCLVHRAEVLQFQGAWSDAIEEACRACERAERADRRPPAAALYQQAEIHRLRGEFTGAEEAYQAASRLGCEPQPGLALLRLAQGRTDAACAAIVRLVGATTNRLERAKLLPAHLDIMLACGNLEDAIVACPELQSLAEQLDSDVLRASALQAQGAIALAQGDARMALGPLRSAFDLWTRLEAPYESARARVLIGLACRALGDRDASALEFGAAREAFDQLGARPDLSRLDSLAADTAKGRDHKLTARERDVLRLVAAGHTNKAIAATLRLSERTIDRHVGNILGKLVVPSRTAATAYAYDHSLL
jgi:DNA-binding CsgD family transcriptional regulator